MALCSSLGVVAPQAGGVGGAVITSTQIMILGVTAVALALLMWLVNYTKLGRAMRATAENPRVAALMGVKPDMVISATFVIGATLAAVAGVMWAANYGTVQHTMGFLPGLKAFTAAVLGGIGNLGGAVVGGILLILPRTRVWGLILVGAILFNIAAVHQFLFGGLKDPTVIGLIVLALIVTWSRLCALCCVNTCCVGGCCSKEGSEGSSCCSSEKPASFINWQLRSRMREMPLSPTNM